MNYDFLNLILEVSIDNNILDDELKNLEEIKKLVAIFLNYFITCNIRNYTKKIDLNESIDNVYGFLKQFDDYGDRFLNILREENDKKYTVSFIKDLSNKQSYTNIDGKVNIFYNESLRDSYTIMHEFIHKFSLHKNKISKIENIIGEVPTITLEHLMKNFLLKKYPYDEVIINKHNDLLASMDKSIEIYTEIILIDLYKKNKRVDDIIINNFLEDLDKSSFEYQFLNKTLPFAIKKIIENKHLSFYVHMRYILGTLTSIYLNDKIKKDSNKIEDLITLINILGNSDLTYKNDIKILNQLDLPFKFEESIIIPDDSVKILTKGYQKEVDNLKKYQRYKIK